MVGKQLLCILQLIWLLCSSSCTVDKLCEILAHRSLFWPLYFSSPELYRHNTWTNFTSRTRAYSVVKLVSVFFLSNVEFHLWVGNFFFYITGHITIIDILMLSLKISNSNRYYLLEFLSDELDLLLWLGFHIIISIVMLLLIDKLGTHLWPSGIID